MTDGDYSELETIERAKREFSGVCVDFFTACKMFGTFRRVTRRVGNSTRFVSTVNATLPPEIFDVWAAPWLERVGRAPVPELPYSFEFNDEYSFTDITIETN